MVFGFFCSSLGCSKFIPTGASTVLPFFLRPFPCVELNLPVNLPIGGLTIFIIAFIFKLPKSADHKAPEEPPTLRQRVERFDPWYFLSFGLHSPALDVNNEDRLKLSRGTLSFIPAIVSLLLALQWGGSKYAWNDGRIIALFVLFGILITAFVGIQ